MLLTYCDHCGKTYPAGTTHRCKYAKNQLKDYNLKRDPVVAALYHSTSWKKTRYCIKVRFAGIDDYTKAMTGRVQAIPSGIVHHIIPTAEDRSKAYDPSNLIYVSRSSHKQIHDIYDKSPEDKTRLQRVLLAYVKANTIDR